MSMSVLQFMVSLRCNFSLTTIAIVCISIALNQENAIADTIHFESYNNSNIALFSGAPRTKDQMVFADMNGDGSDEFIGIQYMKRLRTFAFISTRLKNNREFLWRSSSTDYLPQTNFLVGKIDEDPENELVMFTYLKRDPKKYTIGVLERDGNEFVWQLSNDEIYGNLAKMVDIDDDGIQEIAMISYTSDDWGSRELMEYEPATLWIIKFSGLDFKRVFSYSLPQGIAAIAAGDLDGDGFIEIVTYEKSIEEDVDNKFGIHTIDPDFGFRRRAAINHFIPSNIRYESHDVFYMDIYSHCNRNYLYVETKFGHSYSIFSLEMSAQGELYLNPSRHNEFYSITEAIRSSMAYSTENRTYAIENVSHYYELVPEYQLRTDNHEQLCDAG